jgi:hypothetical protein
VLLDRLIVRDFRLDLLELSHEFLIEVLLHLSLLLSVLIEQIHRFGIAFELLVGLNELLIGLAVRNGIDEGLKFLFDVVLCVLDGFGVAHCCGTSVTCSSSASSPVTSSPNALSSSIHPHRLVRCSSSVVSYCSLGL